MDGSGWKSCELGQVSRADWKGHGVGIGRTLAGTDNNPACCDGESLCFVDGYGSQFEHSSF